jgi:hypothetical protein
MNYRIIYDFSLRALAAAPTLATPKNVFKIVARKTSSTAI